MTAAVRRRSGHSPAPAPWDVAAAARDADAPEVSVTLVTYNGARWVRDCLASVRAQTVQGIELLVFDNGSDDGTVALLAEALRDWPGSRLTSLPTNLGFAAAHDLAISESQGRFVLVLNQDMILEPDFVEQTLAAFDDPRVGAVQAKLLRLADRGCADPRFDSTGLQPSPSRRIVSRGQGLTDDGRFDEPGEVFGADGPAPIYRRAALDDALVPDDSGALEVFDRSFFMYKEDVDLAWRLRLLGWRTRYVPAAVAWHARGTGSGGPRDTDLQLIRSTRRDPMWIKRTSWRNQRLMQVKNDLPGPFLAALPAICGRELRAMAYMLFVEPQRLGVLLDTARLLPSALRKRRWIMARRRATVAEMGRWFSASDGRG
jgi:GT2 family glycosyltransferase